MRCPIIASSATRASSRSHESPSVRCTLAEVELRTGMTLFGCLEVPLSRFGVVLRHALARVVHYAEVELRVGVTLFGCLEVPLSRFGVVLRHACARVVHYCVV